MMTIRRHTSLPFSADSPDCLPILLMVSVFFLLFSFFPLFSLRFLAVHLRVLKKVGTPET